MYLKADLKTFDLTTMGGKFDVILIEPPLEEYFRGAVVASDAPKNFWSWNEILNLDIAEISAHRSFVFLWCGRSEGWTQLFAKMGISEVRGHLLDPNEALQDKIASKVQTQEGV